MNYTVCYPISLGATKVGLTLNAQLVDGDGDDVGSSITTGFAEIGDGNYSLTTDLPDDNLGIIKIYESGTTRVLAIGDATDPRSVLDGIPAACADALLDRADAIDSKTVREALEIMAAILAGKVSGAGTGTETFKGLDGSTDRVRVVVNVSGNRSAVIYDPET